MKKLFDKSELTFAIVLIVIYVVGSSLMQRVSGAIGIQFAAETVFNLILSIVIIVFARKNQLMKHLGLCKSDVSASKMLFYVPLVLVACTNTFFSIGITCIVFHAFNNSISAVSDANLLVNALGSKETAQLLTAAIGIAIAVAYTLYIIKALPKRELSDETSVKASLRFGQPAAEIDHF